MPLEIQLAVKSQHADRQGGEELFSRALSRFNQDARDWSPAFRIIARDVLAPFVQRQFDSQGVEGGTKWADLAPSTIKGRPAGPLLLLTGRLLRSFTEPGGGHVEDVQPRKLVWGSQVPYAVFHQTGALKGFQRADGVPSGRGTGRGMPMRPILALTEPLRQRITSVMMNHMADIARLSGFGVGKRADEALSSPQALQAGNVLLG